MDRQKLTRRVSREERDAYRRTLEDRYPDYPKGWHQPTTRTAEAVWSLLSGALKLTIDDLLPPGELLPEDWPEVELTAKKALTIAIDAAISAGERGRMLTVNLIFDALARCWSLTYRETIEKGPATISYDMRVETVRKSGRELLMSDVRIDRLWPIIYRGHGKLYRTNRKPKRGYHVHIDPGAKLYTEFLRIIEDDPDYQRQTSRMRLLPADDPLPPRRIARKVAGETAYNLVESGRRSLQVMEQLEAARLYLDVPALLEEADRLERALEDRKAARIAEYARLRRHPGRTKPTRQRPKKTRERLSELWQAEHAAKGHFAQLRAIREQARDLEAAGGAKDDLIEIKTRVFRTLNRRYHAANFWPAEVTGKDVQEDILEGFEHDDVEFEVSEFASRRGRLFKAAATIDPVYRDKADDIPREWKPDFQTLFALDISSSLLQIMSVLFGMTALEAELRRHSFKERMAQHAWSRHRSPRDPFKLSPRNGLKFAGPDDPKFQEALKKAAMTLTYGSNHNRVSKLLMSDTDTYGPGIDEKALKLLFDDFRTTRQIREKFLPVCHEIAKVAVERDRYAGVVLTDPFDGATIRWNPLTRSRGTPVRIARLRAYVRKPLGSPNADGDYPVNLPKLQRMILPCLIHTLDAMFCGFVMEALRDEGVRDVVAVHDCWMVAADAEAKLLGAIVKAGRPWLKALGPVYDDLYDYLRKTKYGPLIEALKTKWQRRVRAKRWPQFRFEGKLLTRTGVEIV